MKLLFDQNLSFKLCKPLGDLYPGSVQVRLLGLQQADDRVVWKYAKDNGFVLVSQDADFADLATLYGPPPKLIWLRCGNQSTASIEKRLRDHATIIQEFEKSDTVSCLEIF
jgi:predicted nuclease of predicted toxin-antitoxin system